MQFTLYSRSYCHLCHEMLDALLAMRSGASPFTVEVIDIDADAALVARFDELVPVLFGALNEAALCHYVLDGAKVTACLVRAGAPGIASALPVF